MSCSILRRSPRSSRDSSSVGLGRLARSSISWRHVRSKLDTRLTSIDPICSKEARWWLVSWQQRLAHEWWTCLKESCGVRLLDGFDTKLHQRRRLLQMRRAGGDFVTQASHLQVPFATRERHKGLFATPQRLHQLVALGVNGRFNLIAALLLHDKVVGEHVKSVKNAPTSVPDSTTAP